MRHWSSDGDRRSGKESIMPYALRNQTVHVPSIGKMKGTGWLPPLLDMRDYTPASPELKPETKRLKEQRVKHHKSNGFKATPTSVDLRQWCSDIEDQGQLGSCTAHAAVCLLYTSPSPRDS